MLVQIDNFNPAFPEHNSFGPFHNIILLKLVKLNEKVNGWKLVELNLYDLLFFREIQSQLFVFPLLLDISIFQPNHFVSQLFVTHQSLYSWSPYLNPSVVVFCHTNAIFEFSFVIYWVYFIFIALFHEIQVPNFHFYLFHTQSSLKDFFGNFIKLISLRMQSPKINKLSETFDIKTWYLIDFFYWILFFIFLKLESQIYFFIFSC